MLKRVVHVVTNMIQAVKNDMKFSMCLIKIYTMDVYVGDKVFIGLRIRNVGTR
jgi:hypothetical protein